MIIDLEKEWKKLWDALEESSVLLNEFLSGSLPISAQKPCKKFVKAFDGMKPIAERLDTAIRTPIEPLTVELPWQEVEFSALWAFWKDYRLEKFHLRYVSREEKKSLQYLKEISDNDCEKAKSYLDFAMAKGYRNFFVPSEKSKYQPEIPMNDEGERPFNG